MRFSPVVAVQRFLNALTRPKMQATPLYAPDTSRGWFTIFDWKSGAWQQDAEPVNMSRAEANWAVWACRTLIAADLGKVRCKLMERGENGIRREIFSPAFSPVLKKPNTYQTWQKFIESWLLSKTGPCGNTYVLKIRDNRNVVVQMHVLNPYCVTPLISPNGSVFYRLGEEWLAGLENEIPAAPASEIIHDRGPCLFHPLVGISPLYAAALAAQQGLSIQGNSEQFFRNKSMPGGIITAPTPISDTTAERLKREWNARYSGDNAGKTAVLGDGLTYQPLNVNARDAQLTDQLLLTAKMICSAYHVPPFKIGIEALPAGQKVEDMNRIYYSDCLHSYMKSIEDLLDEGLGLSVSARDLSTDIDELELLKMDFASLADTLVKLNDGTIMTPNEARAQIDLPPKPGGDALYKQQQEYSLEALQKRDAQDDPFGTSKQAAPDPTQSDEEADDEEVNMLGDLEFLFKTAPLTVRGINAGI